MVVCPHCDSLEISLVQHDPNEPQVNGGTERLLLRDRPPVNGLPIAAYCRSCEREFAVPNLHRIHGGPSS